MVNCKKCDSTRVVKAGMIKGNQRFKCKVCGCQFQPNRRIDKPESTKRLSVLLCMLGLPLPAVARIVKCEVGAVSRWIRLYGGANVEKMFAEQKELIVGLDEMSRRLMNKKKNDGYGRLIAAIPVNLATGNVEGEVLLHFQDFN